MNYEMEESNPSTSIPRFYVNGLEGRGGNTSFECGALSRYRTEVSSLEDWRSTIELITHGKLVWAGGYAPPLSVCKTDVLLLHQAHVMIGKLDLEMGLVTHMDRFTRSVRLSATLELWMPLRGSHPPNSVLQAGQFTSSGQRHLIEWRGQWDLHPHRGFHRAEC